MFPQCFGDQGFRRTWEDTLSLGLDGIRFSHKDLTASITVAKDVTNNALTKFRRQTSLYTWLPGKSRMAWMAWSGSSVMES